MRGELVEAKKERVATKNEVVRVEVGGECKDE